MYLLLGLSVFDFMHVLLLVALHWTEPYIRGRVCVMSVPTAYLIWLRGPTHIRRRPRHLSNQPIGRIRGPESFTTCT
ncbi:hypothetical protein F5Y07DRAFT_351291 [Xylaria sp. FL0933]|nr:hypothetical protein F5Y07DRAFT_351291 [Xylaria sp. FL0933]